MDFDMFWKGKAVEIAAMEQLELTGKLSTSELFVRAKDIYNKGYEHDIKNWKTFWSEKEDRKEEESTEKNKGEPQATSNKEAKEGFKICPKCGEEVRESWMMHRYKKDGSACGHKWENG